MAKTFYIQQQKHQKEEGILVKGSDNTLHELYGESFRISMNRARN